MPKTVNKQTPKTYVADMAILVDELLSPNIGRTPEGYLVCKDVKVARVGTQRYAGREIGQDEAWDDLFEVYRLPDDVFSAETLASFEGKPITDGHPPGYFVTSDNFSMLAKGHGQNARKMGDFIVMDLIINDPTLISKVENKVIREVSMGYSCHYAPHGDTFKQIEIRGNHIAIVDKGRAGKKVAINDHKPKGKKHMKNALKKQVLDSLIAAEADADTIMEAMQLFDQTKEKETETKDNKTPNWFTSFMKDILPSLKAKDEDGDGDDDDKKDKDEEKKTEDRIAKLESGQKEILDAINGLKNVNDDDDEDDDKDKEKTTDDDGDDKDDEDKKEASDAAIKQLRKELKPILATLPAKDRDAIKATLDAALGKKAADKNTAYAKIQEIIAKSSKTRTGDGQTVDHVQRGKDIAAKYNTGYRHLKVADNK